MRLAESPSPVGAPPLARRRRKALVVDDDASARFMLKSLLTRCGYEVAIATHGRDAIDMFMDDPSDIVFMDLYMPHMDGLEAAQRIKALSVREFVPVIFVSGAAETQDLVRGIEAGGDDFLTKPYDEAVLKAKIRALERIRTLHRNSARLHERARADWDVAQSLLAEVVMGGNPRTSALHVDLTPTDAFSADVALAAYSPSGDMNILLGDFTGHGLAAALAALPTAEIFRSMTAKGFAPQQILLEVNRKLKAQLPVGKFFAAAFLQVSDSLEHVWVANCGMPDVLVLGPDGVRERIRSSALPLGVQADLDLGACMRLVHVRRGERILMTSDGIHEAMNDRGEQFGAERLERAAVLPSGLSAAQRVKTALDDFRGSEPIADDSSLVEVQLVPELFAPRTHADAGFFERRDCSASGEWRIALELHADALRVTDPVPMLLSQLQQVPGLDPHRCVLYTVLSELYSNALDHGVLQLNSRLKDEVNGFERYLQAREQLLATLEIGWVAIKIVCSRWPCGGQMSVEMEDSGPGFDWRALPTVVPTTGTHGRGLHLLRGLCQTLSFEGPGNKVRATYVWGDTETRTADAT
jgi:CheY-like chemotaxis protein